MRPVSVATGGYLDSPLAVVASGYLGGEPLTRHEGAGDFVFVLGASLTGSQTHHGTGAARVSLQGLWDRSIPPIPKTGARLSVYGGVRDHATARSATVARAASTRDFELCRPLVETFLKSLRQTDSIEPEAGDESRTSRKSETVRLTSPSRDKYAILLASRPVQATVRRTSVDAGAVTTRLQSTRVRGVSRPSTASGTGARRAKPEDN